MKLFYIALLYLSPVHTDLAPVQSTSPPLSINLQKDLILYLKDKNGQPIPKATLKNQTQDQHFEFGQDGKLILKTSSVNAGDEFLITCIGFKSIQLTGTEILKNPGRIITLPETSQDLKEVSIQSSGFKLDFKNVAKLPYPLSFHAIASDKEFVYVIGGTSQWNILKQALKYSPATNSWTLLSNKILPTFQSSAGYIESTGKIYVIGGMTSVKNHTIFEKVETIDVKTGEVQILPIKNPMPATYAGSAVWNNKMYIFGGSTRVNSSWRGPAANHVYEFAPITLKFTKITEMPEEVQTSGAIVNGVLYVFGGFNSQMNYISSNIHAYDLEKKTWELVCTLPDKLSANAIAVQGPLIFTLGGYNNQSFTGYLNTQTKKFIKVKSNMADRRHAGAVVLYNHLMVMGGGDNHVESDNSQVADLKELIP